VLDATDIDMLTTEVRAETHSPLFDLNGDSLVDQEDRKVWVVNLRQTWFGDANMDSEFNSSDLVQAFQRGEYEDSTIDNSTWADGDWNGNGEFESGDLVVAFVEGGYEKGLRTDIAMVPEPSTVILALIAVLALVSLRGRPLVVGRQQGATATPFRHSPSHEFGDCRNSAALVPAYE
jgi:hypothetical protein